jgi:cytochrome c oxidase subunit IV
MATAVAHREHPNYMGVFVWLAVLTVLEIGVIYLPLTKFAIVLLLIGLALTKATLVALYYMHLKFERRTLGMIAVVPLILCVFLVFMLTPDLGAVIRHSPKSEAPAHAEH